MEVVSLSSTNFIGLTSTYVDDATFKINQNIYYTEDGLEIPYTDALVQLNDNSINNFSNLFLTNSKDLSSVAYIENLSELRDEGFSTYLAANALIAFDDTTKFLVVQEPGIEQETAFCAMTGTYEEINNRYMFDIEFLSDKLCKISHENENIIRYLTVDYLGNLIFAKDGQFDYLVDQSPQIFYYIYNRSSDFIVFLKNNNDIAKYIVYNPDLPIPSLSLGDPLTGADLPYQNRAVFKCTPRSEAPNDTKLVDSWVSYTKDFKTNSLDVNNSRSFESVSNNLLINNEFYSVTGTDMTVNILSLKNTNTPENLQSRSNPFQANRSPLFNEKSVQNRNYKKLFTGSNQRYGNDNITFGYDTFTTDIVLPADTVTYFHMPYDIYPYIQLNIKDSGLIEAGAIASDHPLKSDKIFKKLSTFKYTSPYGYVSDEASGNFLCSWLSGNWDVNSRPVWIDRYYNPSQISFFAALTSNPFQAIRYTSQSECLFNDVNAILRDVSVFDKPSDMVFEPGTYYAYHHYGSKDIKKYINSLDKFIVQKGFERYLDLSDTPVTQFESTSGTYIFDGNRYAGTGSLSSIQETGQFTISFNAATLDWSVPFGSQIIGNYTTDGFGIFNENVTTPTLYATTLTGMYVLNTDLKRLKTVFYDSEVAALIRHENITDYYIIFKDGSIKQYNSGDSVIRSIDNNQLLTNVINYDYTKSSAYLLCSATPITNRIIQINLPSLDIGSVTASLIEDGSLVFPFDSVADFFPLQQSIANMLSRSKTIDYYNGKLYLTPGSISRRLDNQIYYLKDGDTIAKWENIQYSTATPVTTAFKSRAGIQDFNIDFDNNIWILTNDNTYFKYTPNREFILSGTTTNKDFTNYKIGFIADFINGEYKKQVLLIQKGLIVIKPNPYISTVYDIIDSDDNYFVSGFKETIVANTFQVVSGSGLLFNILDTSGTVLSSSTVLAVTGTIFDPTNSDYLRKVTAKSTVQPNLNAQCTMVNIFNSNDTTTVNLPFGLSALDTGEHHFAVRVDTYGGTMSLFIDGQLASLSSFPPRKYQFHNFSKRPFLAGTANFINSIPLFKYLKKNESITKNLQISNFYLFNKALNDADIAILAKEGMQIQDIHFNVPCGSRNYLEEVERFFKASTPGSKSTLFNLVIKNSNITDAALRLAIEQRLLLKLKDLAPVYSKLNKIKWVD